MKTTNNTEGEIPTSTRTPWSVSRPIVCQADLEDAQDTLRMMKFTTNTPRTDAEVFEIQDCNGQLRKVITTQFAKQLERELAEADDTVERLRTALQSCWWATNTYDGDYTRACDNVATIAINALKTQDK